MRKTVLLVLVVTVAALGFPAVASAQVVPDRPTLLAILGATAVTEGFETFNVAAGGAVNMSGVTTLDSATTYSGQGPNLVIPGFSFSSTSATVQWNGDGYYALPTKTITANGQPAVVDFTAPTTAFGVDLLEFTGYSETATVTVYAPDRTTVLYTSSGISVVGATPVFFGYQAAGGIGRVRIAGANYSWSPLVDNLTFGSAPIEPIPALGGWGLLGLAVLLGAAAVIALRRLS